MNCWGFKRCGREKVDQKQMNWEYAQHIPITAGTAPASLKLSAEEKSRRHLP